MLTLQVSQSALGDGSHRVEAVLTGAGPPVKTVSQIQFALAPDDRERIRWYLEDYLEYPVDPAPAVAAEVERRLEELGENLFTAIFGDGDARDLWAQIRNRLPQVRVEVQTDVAEAAGLPWELLRDPKGGVALALQATSFVRVNAQPATQVTLDESQAERLRVLLVICRPAGDADVPFRSVAAQLVRLEAQQSQLLELDVLRPPTFARLTAVLEAAKRAGRPYHVVHFDGHGTYLDTAATGDRGPGFSQHRYAGRNFLSRVRDGGHGYLMFEDADNTDNEQLVDGPALGHLLARTGVPWLVLNACRSAYAEAPTKPLLDDATPDVHSRVRAYGSLALEVTAAGVAGVVAMRYSVYVVTAAQFVANLYSGLLDGQPLGEAVSNGRRQLAAQPNRAIAFDPRPLRDWSVPVVYEAVPLTLFTKPAEPIAAPTVATGRLPHRPDVGFFGRDETLLALDRAFDKHRIVLLHAYAGAGKTTTAVEFARWYAATGGLDGGGVLFSSLEYHTPLARLLSQLGELLGPSLESQGIHWQTLDAAQQRDLAIQELARTPLLWVWDNVEPVAGFPAATPSAWSQDEQEELVEFLRDLTSSQARVLLTSRRDEQGWLGDLPARVMLPMMPMRERIQLARALAERHSHKITDVEDWRPLLRYSAGNPLTITVLVGQALRDGLTSKAQIEAFVARLLAGETDLADDVAQGRSRSLGASLGYGFAHAFTDTERAQLAVLYLFRDVVSVDALRIMGDRRNEAFLTELQGLVHGDGVALLDRAADIGLLTALGRGGFYAIHPALPWYFRHLFSKAYGPPEQARAERAAHAYAVAIAGHSTHFQQEYGAGRHQAIEALAALEANLLHARTLARSAGRWSLVIDCMQGLDVLYGHLGRNDEWTRLVDELTVDLVDPVTDAPVPGREAEWSLFTEYRVGLAENRRDWTGAERLQLARVAWNRDRANEALAADPDHLTAGQRNRVRTLVGNLQRLGHVLRVQGRTDCVVPLMEAAELSRRVGARREEAIVAFHLGHAYSEVPGLENFDLAEHWYGRILDLIDADDRIGHAKATAQLGKLAFQRYRAARQSDQPAEAQAQHLERAARFYHEAVEFAPAGMLDEHAAYHSQLGRIYTVSIQPEIALRHFQKAIKYDEDAGNRFGAGEARLNAAAALGLAGRASEGVLYARAAIRDFESYGAAAAYNIDQAKALIATLERRIGAGP